MPHIRPSQPRTNARPPPNSNCAFLHVQRHLWVWLAFSSCVRLNRLQALQTTRLHGTHMLAMTTQISLHHSLRRRLHAPCRESRTQRLNLRTLCYRDRRRQCMLEAASNTRGICRQPKHPVRSLHCPYTCINAMSVSDEADRGGNRNPDGNNCCYQVVQSE